MTRKDYNLIAAALKQVKPYLSGFGDEKLDQAALYGFKLSANMLATELAADNPAFNRERFLTACGVDD